MVSVPGNVAHITSVASPANFSPIVIAATTGQVGINFTNVKGHIVDPLTNSPTLLY